MTKPPDRFDSDNRDTDIWVTNVDVHIERMGSNTFWIGIYRNQQHLSLYLVSSDRVRCSIGENDLT